MTDHATSDLSAHARKTDRAEARADAVEAQIRAELRSDPATFYEALGQFCPGADPNDGFRLIGEPLRQPPVEPYLRKLHEQRATSGAQAMRDLWLCHSYPKAPAGFITSVEYRLYAWLSDLVDTWVDAEVQRRIGAAE